MMKFTLGSLSQMKLNICQKIIKQILGHTQFEIDLYPAKSQVPETPWDNQTPLGSKNRAIDSKDHQSESDYWIGLESGLIERFGHVFEEAWCCVVDKSNQEYYGYSSGLKVPDYITNRMKSAQLEHFQVMELLEKEHDLSDSDTWANYSGNKIARDISLEEALRNALIQVFSPTESLYNK